MSYATIGVQRAQQLKINGSYFLRAVSRVNRLVIPGHPNRQPAAIVLVERMEREEPPDFFCITTVPLRIQPGCLPCLG